LRANSQNDIPAEGRRPRVVQSSVFSS
jgi:hypothetical protein